jgi:uncharacterized protein YjbJ (UPF0337 family)
MGFLDRLLGRTKKAAGDLANAPTLRREGQHQESQGAAEDRASQYEDMAQEQRTEAAQHEAARDDTM